MWIAARTIEALRICRHRACPTAPPHSVRFLNAGLWSRGCHARTAHATEEGIQRSRVAPVVEQRLSQCPPRHANGRQLRWRCYREPSYELSELSWALRIAEICSLSID